MASTQQAIKQINLRWPEEFWATVSKIVVDRRTTMQALVMEAVAEKLGIPSPNSETEAADDAA